MILNLRRAAYAGEAAETTCAASNVEFRGITQSGGSEDTEETEDTISALDTGGRKHHS